jgi:BMFP domain-containing protein YqiC
VAILPETRLGFLETRVAELEARIAQLEEAARKFADDAAPPVAEHRLFKTSS